MLFVYNCNPLATMPAQNRVLAGLARDDLFTVVFDQVLTDTARWADVILPATTFLEQYDLALSYGHGAVQLVQPVIEPAGEARPNVEVFRRARRRGSASRSASCCRAIPARLMHVADALPDDAGRRAPEPRHHPRQRRPPRRCSSSTSFRGRRTGRVDLLPAALERSLPR